MLDKEDDHFKMCMTHIVNIRPSCKKCRDYNYKNRKTWTKKGRLFIEESHCKLCAYSGLKINNLLFGLSEKGQEYSD